MSTNNRKMGGGPGDAEPEPSPGTDSRVVANVEQFQQPPLTDGKPLELAPLKVYDNYQLEYYPVDDAENSDMEKKIVWTLQEQENKKKHEVDSTFLFCLLKHFQHNKHLQQKIS